jgi:hypothetical protein
VLAEGGSVHVACVPAHLHHTVFELLKNAYKATVDSAVRKNMNVIPPVACLITPGKDEACIRIRDAGDGMSLAKMEKATRYLYSSSVPYEQQAAVQQSYQPTTEPMTGMGIGEKRHTRAKRVLGLGSTLTLLVRRAAHLPALCATFRGGHQNHLGSGKEQGCLTRKPAHY